MILKYLMVPQAGFEPAASYLEGSCSVHWATGAHTHCIKYKSQDKEKDQKCTNIYQGQIKSDDTGL